MVDSNLDGRIRMNLYDQLVICWDSFAYIYDLYKRLKVKEQIYIFGAGDRAQWVGKVFNNKGIDFQGFLVSRKYYSEQKKANMYGYEKNIFCYEEIIQRKEKITIVLGLPKTMLDMKIFDSPKVEEVIPINLGNREDYLIDFGIIEKHKEELEWLYRELEDDYSRSCLLNCLRGRLTGRDMEFPPNPWSDPEYFIKDFQKWEKEECIVDCGAYDGDTVEEFLKKKPIDTSFSYEIYAWEPDYDNYSKLQERYGNNSSIICINKAAYSKVGRYGFISSGGEMSSLNSDAEYRVDTDTIDSVMRNKKVTFIKMDVEGCELPALMGAERQIRENKPRLAICIYHKQEDLWTIPQYIKQINPEYKLYLETHSSMPTELVLFCR